MSSKNNLQLIDLTKISGVLMDIDDTMYSYDQPNKVAIKSCYVSMHNSGLIESISLSEFTDLYVKHRLLVTNKLQPQGSCRSRQFAFDGLLRDLNINNAYLLADRYEKIYWRNFYNAMKPSLDVHNFLVAVKKGGLLTCAVTDMQATFQIAKLKKIKFERYIDFLATSEEAGAEKPNKAIFQLALKKMQLTKKKVVMIGDNFKKDIKGAESFGIQAIYFKA